MQTTSMKSVLWQSEDKTTVLIDVPGSVAVAQGTADEPCAHVLQSSVPLQKPFSIPAPKLVKAEANLSNNSEDENYRVLLKAALGIVGSRCNGQWCLPRPFIFKGNQDREEQGEPSSRKRKSTDIDQSLSRDPLPPTLLEAAVKGTRIPLEYNVEPRSNRLEQDYEFDYEPGSNLWTYTTVPAILTITSHVLDTATSLQYRFRLPANSVAYLSDCSQPRSFHELVNERQQKFDFILLDPPWPSRSVKRTHQTPGTSYSTTKLIDLDTMLCGLNLRSLLTVPGYVAIWITNKPAVRALILGSGGLFEKWGITLAEEWIWLKTTAAGEPSSPLGDTWNGKKPYEILLVGKSGQSGVTNLKRRVIVGVPDLHSRKPCLKELVGDLIGTEAPVLEIFARYLVSGWWSWGNECLKFNWEGYWQQADEA